jgi:hypothetical protein
MYVCTIWFISYREGREKMKSWEWICDHSFSDCIMPPLCDRYEEKIQNSLSNTRIIKKEPAFCFIHQASSTNKTARQNAPRRKSFSQTQIIRDTAVGIVR